MQNQLNTQLIIKDSAELITESQVMQFLTLGDQLGWHTEVIGKAPMLETSIRLQEWLLVPAHEDTTKLPHRTMKRIETIYSQGLRPRGFVVVHEAPMQLVAPKPEPQVKVGQTAKQGKSSEALSSIATILGFIGLGALLLPMGLVAGLALLDPILVAVTQDGYWIEIDRWSA